MLPQQLRLVQLTAAPLRPRPSQKQVPQLRPLHTRYTQATTSLPLVSFQSLATTIRKVLPAKSRQVKGIAPQCLLHLPTDSLLHHRAMHRPPVLLRQCLLKHTVISQPHLHQLHQKFQVRLLYTRQLLSHPQAPWLLHMRSRLRLLLQFQSRRAGLPCIQAPPPRQVDIHRVVLLDIQAPPPRQVDIHRVVLLDIQAPPPRQVDTHRAPLRAMGRPASQLLLSHYLPQADTVVQHQLSQAQLLLIQRRRHRRQVLQTEGQLHLLMGIALERQLARQVQQLRTQTSQRHRHLAVTVERHQSPRPHQLSRPSLRLAVVELPSILSTQGT